MKTEIGAVNALPTIITLVGANVNQKPNYVTIAWVGVIGTKYILICVNKQRYTNSGIKKNKGIIETNSGNAELFGLSDFKYRPLRIILFVHGFNSSYTIWGDQNDGFIAHVASFRKIKVI